LIELLLFYYIDLKLSGSQNGEIESPRTFIRGPDVDSRIYF